MKRYLDLIQRDVMFEDGNGNIMGHLDTSESEVVEEKVTPVDVVTVYTLIPIYKNEVEANAIQVARVRSSKGEELQYDIIVGKGLWEVGKIGIYVQPDYCLPYTKHFLEYTQPDGDPSKSKLGKKNRVKAIKFNFTFENGDGPIYSNGVLLPMDEELVKLTLTSKDLMTDLQITKYVSEDGLEGTQEKGSDSDFPSFLYKTDEPTIQNKKSSVQKCFEEGELLMGTIKRDGSSITDYYIDDFNFGICSRNNGKSLDQTYVKAYKDGDVMLHTYVMKEYFAKDNLSKFIRFIRSIFGLKLKSVRMKGWYNDETKTFYTEEEASKLFEPVMGEKRDAWVDVNKHFGYLDKLINYCREHKVKLALRGELIGEGNKGSGKSVNNDAKLNAQVIWFGVDDLSAGYSKRIHYGQDHNLKTVSEALGLEYTRPVFEGVYDYDSLIKECHKIFDDYKTRTGQILEGIVIRSKYSNKLSVKYINPEYDVF